MKLKELYTYITDCTDIIIYSGDDILFDDWKGSPQTETELGEEDGPIRLNSKMRKILEREIDEIFCQGNKIRINVVETEIKNSPALREKVHKWVIDLPDVSILLVDAARGKAKLIGKRETKVVDDIFDNYKIISVEITEETHTIIIYCYIDD